MKVIRTNDGTDTLYNNKIDEHYHSIHGAKNESQHVFIEMGLDHVPLSQKSINVFEMGFGTGLNALLALNWAHENDRILRYQTIELNPVSMDLVEQLNFSKLDKLDYLTEKFSVLHLCPWGKFIEIDSSFQILKQKVSLDDVKNPEDIDMIFFDAFSPDKQPELWTVSIFKKMKDILNVSGILVTYCAKGYVRRNMIEAGFMVERLPGPPGKREMLRATKEPHVDLNTNPTL